MTSTKATKEPGIQFIEGIKRSYYRVQIRLKGCPHLSKNHDTFEEAKKWKRKTVAALQSGLPYETTEMRRLTVGDLIDRFIQDDLKKLRNHRTVIGHLHWWKNEIGYCILSQFREDIIAKYRDKLKKELDSLGRPRSPATVNRYLCSLSSVINLAVKEWRLLQTSPMKNISKLPEPRGRERFLTQEERVRLLQVCHGSSCKLLFPIVLLALSTGMRKAEILGIKWKDIDLDSGRITLHHTKNGDSRVVPVKGLALTKLQDLASPHKCNPSYLEEYVFAIKKGGKPIDFRGSWKTALALSEIKNFTFHDIRHDYITALSALGYPLHVISRIVGHRSHAITASRYSHLSLEHAERAASEIGTDIENNYVHFLRHIDINLNNVLECKVIS
jgi:integrase